MTTMRVLMVLAIVFLSQLHVPGHAGELVPTSCELAAAWALRLQQEPPEQLEQAARALPERDYCRADTLATLIDQSASNEAGHSAVAVGVSVEPCDPGVYASAGAFYARAQDHQLAVCFLDKASKLSGNASNKAALQARVAELSAHMPAVPARQLQCARALGQGIADRCAGIRGLARLDLENSPAAASAALRIQFGYNSHALSAQALNELQQVVASLQNTRPADRNLQALPQVQTVPLSRILLVGHTDGRGDDTYNIGLSLRRAQAVARFLAEQMPAARISVEGRGKASLLVRDAHTEAEHQINRRVDILAE